MANLVASCAGRTREDALNQLDDHLYVRLFEMARLAQRFGVGTRPWAQLLVYDADEYADLAEAERTPVERRHHAGPASEDGTLGSAPERGAPRAGVPT
ncbi:hypothetical protein ACFVYG_20520 [Streptomyces sp. NPDC058256]|uniref:hypothetical protein n=1 Tax=Streptomyces sp. NPDC058256 TaxID=3346408 RepID=UPI0036EAF551